MSVPVIVGAVVSSVNGMRFSLFEMLNLTFLKLRAPTDIRADDGKRGVLRICGVDTYLFRKGARICARTLILDA